MAVASDPEARSETTSPSDHPPAQDRITLEELASSSGVDVELGRRLVAEGLIHGDETGRFGRPDITKLRLIRALVEAGFELDELAEAVADGRLSLDFVDLLMPEPVPLVDIPDETASSTDEDCREMIRTMLGSDLEGRMVRQDDLALAQLVTRARELGAPMDHIIRIVRATALSAQHIVALQREFVDEVLLAPAIRETGSPISALAATAAVRYEFRGLGRQMVGLLLERFANDAVFRNIVDLTELSLLRGGFEPFHDNQSVAFIDVSNYTRLSREAGDVVAAEQAIRLIDAAQRSAQAHGGRLVKSLGDGALAHFPNPSAALRFALDLVTNAEQIGLWTLHAGVNSGPMLRRDGDYYGTAVNVASRVADAAAAGEVVVTRRVVDAWDGDSVVFRPLGRVPVKNVDEPVEMFVAATTSPQLAGTESRARAG